MQVIPYDLPGLLVIEPQVFRDSRGKFLEHYRDTRYGSMGIDANFVQDNFSRSRQGTLRGLHYQFPRAQGKLVCATRGEVFDVAVDLRKDSATFGRWVGIRLSDENHRQLYIPPGFAHGFCVLSTVADVLYKCTDYYCAEHERTIRWDDPDLGIDWPIDQPVLSHKDANAAAFSQSPLFATTGML